MASQGRLFYERPESQPEIDALIGPIIGIFTVVKTVELGDHPDFVRSAWVDVPLPVRPNFYSEVYGEVSVYTVDGLAALANNQTPKPVLDYWEEEYDGAGPIGATFVFEASDGVITLERNGVTSASSGKYS